MSVEVCVDIVLVSFFGDDIFVFSEPNQQGYRIFSGFVDSKDNLSDFVRSYAKHKTDQNISKPMFAGIFNKIEHSNKKSFVRIVYLCPVEQENVKQTQKGVWTHIKKQSVLDEYSKQSIKKAFAFVKKEAKNNLKIIRFFLPNEFTINRAYIVYKSLMNKDIDRRNFYKKIKKIVTQSSQKNTGKKTIMYYKFA